MVFTWLLLWLICQTPAVVMWNNWGIGLAICVGIDVLKLNR